MSLSCLVLSLLKFRLNLNLNHVFMGADYCSTFAFCRRRPIAGEPLGIRARYCLGRVPCREGLVGQPTVSLPANFPSGNAQTPPKKSPRAPLRDELVSVHRRRKIRHRRRETSSSRRSARSRLWPAVGILGRLLTGRIVARALWKSAHPRSGISRTDDLYFSESRFFRKVQVWDERAKCLNFGAGISG